jgi:transcriptional regulator with XRE-family HTH domain
VARPERPLDPSDGPIAAFAAELRKLREEAGSPKYLQMARRTGRSRTALAEAAGGDHLPTWETVEAFVTACDTDPAAWLPRWEQAKDDARSGTVALRPAPEPPPDQPGPLSAQRAPWRSSRGVRYAVAFFVAGLLTGALGAVALTHSTGAKPAAPAGVALPGNAGQPAIVSFTHFAAFVDADLATAGPGGKVRIWNAGSKRRLQTLTTRDNRITALAFDPQDQNMLATAGPNGRVQLWDVRTGQRTLGLTVQDTRSPIVLAFNPILRGVLAIGGAKGVVTLWPTQHPDQPTTKIQTGLGPVTSLAFDPHNATTLAVGGPEGADIWDTGTGQQVPGIRLMPGPAKALAFDPLTQNTLVGAGSGSGLAVWDASNGNFVREMAGAQGVTALGFSPQIRNSLVSGDSKGRLQVWDSSSGVAVHRIGNVSAAISSLAFAADGRSLASGDQSGHVEVWRIQDW